MFEPAQVWRLDDAGPDALGLSCARAGLFLAGTALVEKCDNRYVIRPPHEIEALVDEAYAGKLARRRLTSGLNAVANALNDGNLCRARIAAVHLRLPPLAGPHARNMLELTDLLLKLERRDAAPTDRLVRFNPNHYGPGPRGGQFAPADGSDAGEVPSRSSAIQVAQDERDPAEENDSADSMAPVRQALWNSSIRALREIDPNNPALTYFTNPNSAPSQEALDQLNETLRDAIARHAADSTTAAYAARYPALAKPVLQQILQQYPAEYANARAAYLESLLTDRTRKHVTIAIGVVEDSNGARSVIYSSTEVGVGGLSRVRRQVAPFLQPDEIRIPSGDHAEINILQYARENDLRVIAVGAGRPYCPTCGPTLDAAGVLATGPRK